MAIVVSYNGGSLYVVVGARLVQSAPTDKLTEWMVWETDEIYRQKSVMISSNVIRSGPPVLRSYFNRKKEEAECQGQVRVRP